MKYTKSELMSMKVVEIRKIAVDNNIPPSNLSKNDLAERVSTRMNYKKCSPSRSRSPETNRCSFKKCSPGSSRSPQTKRCSKKKCSPKKTRDKRTKKCRKKKKTGPKSKSRSPSLSRQELDDSDEEEMVAIEKSRREVANDAAKQAVLKREGVEATIAEQKKSKERKMELSDMEDEYQKNRVERRRKNAQRERDEDAEKRERKELEKISLWADSPEEPIKNDNDLNKVLERLIREIKKEFADLGGDPTYLLSYIEKVRPIGYKLVKKQQELNEPSYNVLAKLHTEQERFIEDIGSKYQKELDKAKANPELTIANAKKNLRKTQTSDRSIPALPNMKDFSLSSDKKEIPCDSFMGKSSCENEYGEEYENFKLRRCKWNQSNGCEVLTGSLDERLRITLGLSKEEFAVRRRTVDQKNKVIQEEIKLLRLQNGDRPIDFTEARKKVIKNTEDSLKASHDSAKKIEKQVEKVTKEIIKNKEISSEVKELLEEVTSDLAVVVETEKKLVSAKAAKNKGLNNIIDFEAMLRKKQESGAKTDDQLEKLGKGFEEIPIIEEKIEELEEQMNDSRKNLMASIKQASKAVNKSSPSTKEELAKISMSVDLLSSITGKSQSCKMGKIWNSVLETCICRDGEIENEDGFCLSKKIVEKSDWYMSQSDSGSDSEDDYDSDFTDDE
jgi:hypothetical protein